MADLEKELGKKLFVRTNRSTTLTEEGMHLRQRAEEILALVDQTKEEIREDDMDLSGCIRIGAGETRAMHWVTDTFAELHQEYPHLTIELFTNNADGVRSAWNTDCWISDCSSNPSTRKTTTSSVSRNRTRWASLPASTAPGLTWKK